ncbi:MAG TPA: hypothetical protein VML50_13970 [Anaeromyxobacter sp.]|nr:hypothetical protein [Anaeromyxobacter sp.]
MAGTGRRPAPSPAALLLLAACGTVSVTPARSGVTTPPRPRGCSVEFLRAPPARPHDALAELYTYYSRMVEPEEVLREKACEVGADAVIVTLDFVVATDRTPDRKLIAGTAIKYRQTAPPTALPE